MVNNSIRRQMTTIFIASILSLSFGSGFAAKNDNPKTEALTIKQVDLSTLQENPKDANLIGAIAIESLKTTDISNLTVSLIDKISWDKCTYLEAKVENHEALMALLKKAPANAKLHIAVHEMVEGKDPAGETTIDKWLSHKGQDNSQQSPLLKLASLTVSINDEDTLIQLLTQLKTEFEIGNKKITASRPFLRIYVNKVLKQVTVQKDPENPKDTGVMKAEIAKDKELKIQKLVKEFNSFGKLINSDNKSSAFPGNLDKRFEKEFLLVLTSVSDLVEGAAPNFRYPHWAPAKHLVHLYLLKPYFKAGEWVANREGVVGASNDFRPSTIYAVLGIVDQYVGKGNTLNIDALSTLITTLTRTPEALRKDELKKLCPKDAQGKIDMSKLEVKS